MKNPTGEKILQDYFSIGRKNPTRIFDWGMFNPFGPFGRNSPTHCFKWGFSQTVSGKISSKWTKWGKHSQIENACGNFLPMGKIIL
jgi:hypothetical protein